MAIGPGKYDKACTAARESTKASAAVLIVIGGEHGHGFSAQFSDPRIAHGLPLLLRQVAEQIEASQP
jgi:hypothetical protein